MAEYIEREAALKILRGARYDCVYNKSSVTYNGKLDVYRALVDRITALPTADVVPAEEYANVVEQMNTLADKLIKIREIAGCRNG